MARSITSFLDFRVEARPVRQHHRVSLITGLRGPPQQALGRRDRLLLALHSPGVPQVVQLPVALPPCEPVLVSVPQRVPTGMSASVLILGGDAAGHSCALSFLAGLPLRQDVLPPYMRFAADTYRSVPQEQRHRNLPLCKVPSSGLMIVQWPCLAPTLIRGSASRRAFAALMRPLVPVSDAELWLLAERSNLVNESRVMAGWVVPALGSRGSRGRLARAHGPRSQRIRG